MNAPTPLPPAEGTDSDSNSAPGAGNYVGRRVGRYVLLSLLGEGSMGSIWVADDPILNIKVALKLLKPTAPGNHGAERLLREARAVAQVKHPSIVQMLDFGVSQEGEPYLALELLEGETARTFTGTGELTPEMVVGLALPLLDALSMAHEHGIVHRDIKPDNLFIARDARGRIRPKVLDFGISKSLVPQRKCLTKIGTLIGTPAYMAPEQMRGDLDIDPRADLWALTVTIYEMIAGFMPFTGTTVQRLMMAVFDQQPRSLLGVPGVDPELAAIITRGLEKDREQRFPDARTMGNALASWLLGRGLQEDACGTSLRTAWLTPPSAVERLTSRPLLGPSPNTEGTPRPSGVPMTGLETMPALENSGLSILTSVDGIAQAPTEPGTRPSLSWVPGVPPPSWVPGAPAVSWVPGPQTRSRRFVPAILCSAILAAIAVVGARALSSSAPEGIAAPQVAAMSASSGEAREIAEAPGAPAVEARGEPAVEARGEPATTVEMPAPTPAKVPAMSVSRARQRPPRRGPPGVASEPSRPPERPKICSPSMTRATQKVGGCRVRAG